MPPGMEEFPCGARFLSLWGSCSCPRGSISPSEGALVPRETLFLSLWLCFPLETVSCPVGDGFTSLWIYFPLGASSWSLGNHFLCPSGSIPPWEPFSVSSWGCFPVVMVPWEPFSSDLFPSEHFPCPFSSVSPQRQLRVLWEMVSHPFGSISLSEPVPCPLGTTFLVPLALFPLGDSFLFFGIYFPLVTGSLSPGSSFPQSEFLVPSVPSKTSFVSCGRWFHGPLDPFPPSDQVSHPLGTTFLVSQDPVSCPFAIASLSAIFSSSQILPASWDLPSLFLRTVSLSKKKIPLHSAGKNPFPGLFFFFFFPTPDLFSLLPASADYTKHFTKRDLVAFSAEPLLVFPTHYTGEEGYVSDTETSVVWDDEATLTDWDRAKSQKMKEQQELRREAQNSDVLQSPLDSAARDEL